MEQNQNLFFLVAIVLMALVTFLPRAIPLQISTRHWPGWLKEIIEYLPVAIVGAITVPYLLIEDQAVIGWSPGLLAAIPTIVVAAVTRNLILSVVVGTLTFIALDSWVF